MNNMEEMKRLFEYELEKVFKKLDQLEKKVISLESQITMDNNMMLEKTNEIVNEIQSIKKEL